VSFAHRVTPLAQERKDEKSFTIGELNREQKRRFPFTAFSDLSVRHLKKKIGWPDCSSCGLIASGVCNRDEGRYWSCTLVHTPIICRYSCPRPLHNWLKYLRLWMCAALLKNEKESYNKLHLVKGLVPVAHTCACSHTLQIWLHWAITCVY
jgi:hypothetical protein